VAPNKECGWEWITVGLIRPRVAGGGHLVSVSWRKTEENIDRDCIEEDRENTDRDRIGERKNIDRDRIEEDRENTDRDRIEEREHIDQRIEN